MNVHGLKQKKKSLRAELQKEETREFSSRKRILQLKGNILGVCKQIRNKKG